jgi:hypothetical protein
MAFSNATARSGSPPRWERGHHEATRHLRGKTSDGTDEAGTAPPSNPLDIDNRTLQVQPGHSHEANVE